MPISKSLTRFRPYAPAAAIAVALLLLYWPAVGYDFFSLDDGFYTVENPYLLQGLSWGAVSALFTSVIQAYWIPVTWITFLLDIHFFGLDPSVFHRTNVVLFALCVIACYVFIYRAFSSKWVAVAVTALFAFHPMRVESVVWISERKDLLSGLFFFLTLTWYLEYARTGRLRPYVLAFLAMFLGMAAKPILMLAPALMLLLDYWPLGRLSPPGDAEKAAPPLSRILTEKIPFILFAVGMAVFTLFQQREAMSHYAYVPWSARFLEVAAIHVRYLKHTLLPIDLAFGSQGMYQPPGVAESLTGWAIVAAMSVGAFFCRKRAPWFTMGWFWFVVALFPTNSLFRAGFQVTSDRFLFIPVIGLLIGAAWGIHRALTDKGAALRAAGVFFLALSSLGLAAATRAYMPHWRDSIAIYSRSMAIFGESVDAHAAIGDAYIRIGLYDLAIGELRRALELSPEEPVIFFNLAMSYAKTGRDEESERYFRKTIALKPKSTLPRFNLAILLADNGRLGEASEELRKLLALNPGNVQALEVLRLIESGEWGGEAPSYHENRPIPERAIIN